MMIKKLTMILDFAGPPNTYTSPNELIPYIEENFISLSECQEIINYTNESIGIMTAVNHSEDDYSNL